jgi:hypothetical protein
VEEELAALLLLTTSRQKAKLKIKNRKRSEFGGSPTKMGTNRQM